MATETVVVEHPLADFPVETLMTKAFELTHRIHELDEYLMPSIDGPIAHKVTEAREQRDAIVAEMKRRSGE